jgi:hypothetical protein
MQQVNCGKRFGGNQFIFINEGREGATANVLGLCGNQSILIDWGPVAEGVTVNALKGY